MSIKDDTTGTNWVWWTTKDRAKYLETTDTHEPQLDLDNTVTDCPYRFVCKCVNGRNTEASMRSHERWERATHAEELNEKLRAELAERKELEHKYWHLLLDTDPKQAGVFADMVLVSNII